MTPNNCTFLHVLITILTTKNIIIGSNYLSFPRLYESNIVNRKVCTSIKSIKIAYLIFILVNIGIPTLFHLYHCGNPKFHYLLILEGCIGTDYLTYYYSVFDDCIETHPQNRNIPFHRIHQHNLLFRHIEILLRYNRATMG